MSACHASLPPRSRHRRSGNFTLIELLVVIAIISVLAAMLLPALSRAMQAAKAVACLGQIRQVGLGMEEFVSDHDEYYHPAVNGPWVMFRYQSVSGRNLLYEDGYWVKPVSGRAGEASPLLFCPADNSQPDEKFNRVGSYLTNGRICVNGRISDQGVGFISRPTAIRRPAIRTPEKRLFFADLDYHDTWHYHQINPMGWNDGKWKWPGDRHWEHLSHRHNNSANILYLDLHAARLKVPRLIPEPEREEFLGDAYTRCPGP